MARGPKLGTAPNFEEIAYNRGWNFGYSLWLNTGEDYRGKLKRHFESTVKELETRARNGNYHFNRAKVVSSYRNGVLKDSPGVDLTGIK